MQRPQDPICRSRSDADWLAGLVADGSEQVTVTADLADLLRRVLRRSLGDRGHGIDLEDVVQESLLQVLRSLDRFRGDSRFTTWASAIAIRVAFTELRRRRVRDRHTVPFDAIQAESQELQCGSQPDPAELVGSGQVVAALRHAIASSLTERQRLAILAELHGVPTIEIATRLGTNQNALYKLVHDARKKLRHALELRGFGAEALHDFVAEAHPQ